MKKKHTAEFKAKIVLETLKELRTLGQIASENGIHPNMLSRWKMEAIDGLPQIYRKGIGEIEKQRQAYETKMEELYIQIGKLSTEVEWLKKKSLL